MTPLMTPECVIFSAIREVNLNYLQEIFSVCCVKNTLAGIAAQTRVFESWSNWGMPPQYSFPESYGTDNLYLEEYEIYPA